MRCGHPGGGMFSRACTLEQLHDGDHNNGKKTWPLGSRDYARLAVQAIRAGDQGATDQYTERAVLTLMAAYAAESRSVQKGQGYTGKNPREFCSQKVDEDIANILDGKVT